MKTNRNRKVDDYIEKSAEFARPILQHLRELVHRACPEAEEAIKWTMPNFLHHGILCNMVAFKKHCAFGFWHHGMKAVLKKDGRKVADAMGSLGRIASLKDLPDDETMLRYIRTAAQLNESGAPARSGAAKPRPAPKTPTDLAAALRKNKKAAEAFEQFSPSHRREYIEWIIEAKRPETRVKRIATTMEWLAKGKSRNWKYG